MRFRTTIAFAAMAVSLASPQAVMAKAAAPNASEQLRTALEQIRQLQQQVAALQARMDQQDSTATQATAVAQAASEKADQALAQANTASSTAVAANTQAEQASKSASATQWAADTKISGRMYFNASSVDQKSDGVKTPGAGNGVGFNIKRFYLGVDHKFDDTFSVNLTTDISNVVGDSSGTLVGKGLNVKKAYVQAKLDPALIIRLGAADMPWVPFVEGQYGYRHIENVAIDRAGFGTSADWGLHVLGDIPGGVLSYQLSVVNGAGYRNVKVSKSIDVEGRISAKYKGFFAGVGGYIGKLGNDTQGAATFHTAKRLNVAAGYKDELFTLGGEYFHAKNWKNVTTAASDSSDGFSVFGSVNFAPKWSAFGRYDWVNPSRDINPALKDKYFNFGVQFEPTGIVDLALVYKRDAVDNGFLKTTNGTIGGVNRGTYDEFGLFGQVRF